MSEILGHLGHTGDEHMNHKTMMRRGFSLTAHRVQGVESLSRIMIEDLKAYGIFVNLLLPGGAAETGMIPKALGDRLAPVT